MKKLKQTIGIDVAQNELVCTLGYLFEDLSTELKSFMIFKNSLCGFKKLKKWAGKTTNERNTFFVLEATGVYHEKLAYWLHGNSCQVVIVLPNKISNYFRTLEIKTITDKTASQAIARFGLERTLNTWVPSKPIFRKMKQLTRERDQIVAERTTIKNQIHAEKTEAFPNPNSLKRLKSREKLLNKQELAVKNEIEQLVKEDKEIHKGVSHMTSIPGVGILTAAIVLGETNGFELIRNKRQLTSYAGLDVKEKLSGTSVKGKPRISKKGNRHLRKAVHLPALSAKKFCKKFNGSYERLVAKHGIKMKALVSIQRKLLELMFTLYKNKANFDPDFEWKNIPLSLEMNTCVET